MNWTRSTAVHCTSSFPLLHCSGLWVWKKCRKRKTWTGSGEDKRGNTEECKSLLAGVSSPPQTLQHGSLCNKKTASENWTDLCSFPSITNALYHYVYYAYIVWYILALYCYVYIMLIGHYYYYYYYIQYHTVQFTIRYPGYGQYSLLDQENGCYA